MKDSEDRLPSPLDLYGPIDFAHMKDTIGSLGPLIMSSPGNPYTVIVEVMPCQCAEEECSKDLYAVWRKNGHFVIHWLLEKDDLEEHQSLESFRQFVIAGGLDDSRAERMLIQAEAEEAFDSHFTDVPDQSCFCSACAEAVGKDNLWKRMLLSQLSMSLSDREYHLEHYSQEWGDEAEEVLSRVFDLGFSTGRIFSEFKFKRFIEPDALAGAEYGRIKSKRAARAGKSSASKRELRMVSLIDELESLCEQNPSISRIGANALAKLAAQDAKKKSPKLWSQGLGQIDEYIGLIRRGEAGEGLRARYQALFSK